ncbi:sensor histidine kinase [Ectobacillus antri]|jgi:two-component system sensor histidine kinase DesK|uniref:histidine kinase n=1 Tax=Ectobacillus antri TaxID=2486280 RepID=A0ABT6H6E6_9BACI|nr:sensor histidine kinase [Ectobacillus antri]MDG4657800.1 sensor histidine kinase [Ectobacillus antri]MDG5754809.1 sensor histidine kinase [Ectobacillus antri]
MRKTKFRLFPDNMGHFPLVWLIYLLMPLYYVLQEPIGKRIAGCIMLAIFVVIYRQAYFATKYFFGLIALQMLIIFTLSWFYHVNYIYMGFFPANFIGAAKTRKTFAALFAMLAALVALVLWKYELRGSIKDILGATPAFVLMFVFPFVNRSMMKRHELQLQLKEANEQIQLLTKKEERQRIARDLHDTLGHTLSLITLKSQLVERLVTKQPERAQMEAKEIAKTSRAALKQVRELITDMRSVTIAEEIMQVQAILQAADIAFIYDVEADLENIPPLTQNVLGMCLREAVTNVVKHSQAKECRVGVYVTKGETVLEIRDDGIGIQKKEGNGLNGILERIGLLEGILRIVSGDQGTTLIIAIPIVRKQKDGMTG